MSVIYIYILNLKGGKYYVGKSLTPVKRVLNHFARNGSEWTKMYPPISVKEYFQGDEYDEDKITKKMMCEYGIENVRGGSYCQIELTSEQYTCLVREICTARDLCFVCGKSGHFSGQCLMTKTQSCRRCGRNTHNESTCYASTHVSGCEIYSEEDVCFRCGREGHWVSECYAKTDVNGKRLQ